MKIKIDLKIFLIMFIFLITNQFKIYWIFMFFVLIHELAHLLAGILLGLKPEKLEIMPLRSVYYISSKSKKGIK